MRVWAPVWPLFELFAACATAWRHPPLGGPPLGLDWVQVQALAAAFAVPWNRETVVLMQAMEGAAGAVWLAEWKRKNPD